MIVAGRQIDITRPVAGDILAAGWRVALSDRADDDVRIGLAIEGHSPWNGMRAARPSGVSPGFSPRWTSCCAHARSAAETGPPPAGQTLSYVYKNAVYDLTPRRIERVPYLRTRAGVLRNLLRSDVAVRNRTTGYTAGFKIVYGIDGALAGIPVAATYQPSWWFKVELELDDDHDVPPDPAAGLEIRRRMSALCPPLGRDEWAGLLHLVTRAAETPAVKGRGL